MIIASLIIVAFGIFFIVQNFVEKRVTAAVSALAVALKAAELDFFGPGNQRAGRAFNRAQQMLRGAQERLEQRDWVAANEMASLGREFLKLAYLKSSG